MAGSIPTQVSFFVLGRKTQYCTATAQVAGEKSFELSTSCFKRKGKGCNEGKACNEGKVLIMVVERVSLVRVIFVNVFRDFIL